MGSQEKYTPIDSDRAHDARVELQNKLDDFVKSIAPKYPTLTFRQDEEYFIIGNPEAEHPVEVQILRSKLIPMKDAPSVPIEEYITQRCDELTAEE